MIGRRLAQRYELLEELEPGNLGRVYLAEDPLLERRVLVKLFRGSRGSDSGIDLEALLGEGRRIARLSHPVIARLFDVGRYDVGRYEEGVFFVLPRLRGRSLGPWCRERELDFGDLLSIGADLAEALAHAARGGVLHRDVRPETIQVVREHGQLRCWLTNFYPVAGGPGGEGAGEGPAILATPEVLAGRPADHRSDLWCLARVLRDALVREGGEGSIDHRTEGPEGEREKLGMGEGGWLPGLGGELAGGLDRWLGGTLADDPAERPDSGDQLAEALRHLRDQAGEAIRRRRPATRVVRPTFQRPALVGRETELELFEECLGRLETQGSHFVLVGGEAGMGSTRLLEELEQKALDLGFTVLWSRLARRDGGQPLAVFRYLLDELLRRRGEGGESGPGPLEPLLAELSAHLPGFLDHPQLAGSEGMAPSPKPPPGDLHDVLARALMALAGERPMVLLVENLHGDGVSFEALTQIVRRLAPKPVLVAGSYRPSEVVRSHPLRAVLRAERDDPRLDVVRLGPLFPGAHARLCAGLLELPDLPPALGAELLEASDGNPYFTRELVRSLVESGDLPHPGTSAWGLKVEWPVGLAVGESRMAMPASVRQVVERRLAGLDPGLVGILETAAVLGPSFALRLLLAIVEGPAETVEDGVDELVRLGLLEEEGRVGSGTLRFSGSVLQDVLYRRLPERRRRAVHRRYAEALERRWAGRLERVYPQLVHHFGSAGRPVETLTYALVLARQSADRWSPVEVVRAARRGLEVFSRGILGDEARDAGEVEGELRRLLATALERQGSFGAAIREAGASALAFERADERLAAARSAALAARVAWCGRRVVAARRWARWAIERWPTAAGEEAGRHLLGLGALLAELAGDRSEADRCRYDAVELAGEPTDGEGRRGTLSGLRIALGERVGGLDPVAARGLAIEPSAAIYETLLRQRSDGGIVPWLAASWTFHDATRLDIELRPGVRFHDGRRLTAEVVVLAFERLAALGDEVARRPIESLLDPSGRVLVGVRPLGPSRLRLTPRWPEPLLPWLLTVPSTAVALSANDRSEEPVGTGPYRCLRPRSDRLELLAFERYWRPGRPRTRTLMVDHGVSAEAMLEGARTGTLALALGVAQEVVDGLRRRAVPGIRTFEVPAWSTLLLWLDPRRPAMADRHRRRAFVASLGLETWLVPSLGSHAVRASSLWPPGLPGAGGRPVDETFLVDDERAAAAPGEAARPSLVARVDDTARRDHAALWRGLARAISGRGIDLEVRTTAEGVDPLERAGEAVDLVFGRWQASYFDGAAFLDFLAAPAIAPALPDVLRREAETIRRCPDPSLRAARLQQMHRELWHETLLVPLGHEQHHGFAACDLGHLDLSPIRPELRFDALALVS